VVAGAGGIALSRARPQHPARPCRSLVTGFGSGRRLDRLREAWAGYWSLFRGLVFPVCALFGRSFSVSRWRLVARRADQADQNDGLDDQHHPDHSIGGTGSSNMILPSTANERHTDGGPYRVDDSDRKSLEHEGQESKLASNRRRQ